jgi:hypothetical protein
MAPLQGLSKSISSGLLSAVILYDTHSADRKRPYNEGTALVSTTKYALCYPKAYVLVNISGRAYMAKFMLVLCS